MDQETAKGAALRPWPTAISAITLFVEDLAAAKQFYRETFGLPVAFEDDNSTVFKFGNTLINLLKTTAVGELIEPAIIAPREAGSRVVFTIMVDDVDALCAELIARGVELLNGPIDRPWGSRSTRRCTRRSCTRTRPTSASRPCRWCCSPATGRRTA